MGVSLGWYPLEPERVRPLNVGWRSMMHSLLSDNGLIGALDKDDIPALRRLGREQCKGMKSPPFDYADDIKKAFEVLIRAIRKHGSIVVTAQW